MNLPNKLTVLRIALIPVMVVVAMFEFPGDLWGIPTLYWILNGIFVIASITDFLDGAIARKTNDITTFGKFADPLADKILVLSTMMILLAMGKIPSWIPIIIITRDFVVSGYRMLEVEKGGKVIAASFWGKLKTCTQIGAIIAIFLSIHNFGAFWSYSLTGWHLFINVTATIMFILATIATVFSGYDYLKDSKKLFEDSK
ncbi:MAG: CDP-diacylglycerol--glycerol-3-phosphate 3-phosphatidyltransferase [Oscillospiraceae bacterium]|nr:CDP-diacylglycerol--glycerol-3-phosphate 3-phosphatidyltransferase [Oscillospiraceae bacterium]